MNASAPVSPISALRRKIGTSWLTLFSGSSVGSALSLLGFILMSRTISVEFVGIVAVVQTYWRIIEGFLSFQSFQVLISFGAEALNNKDGSTFRHVVRTCFGADIVVALAGTVGGIAGLALFAEKMNIPADFTLLAMAGGAMMLSMVTGAPSGVLRLYDRFSVVAAREVVIGAFRAGSGLIGFLLGLTPAYFLVMWILAEVLGNAMLIIVGCLVLRREGYGDFLRRSASSAVGTVQLIKSLLAVNLSSMVRITSEEGDVLLVNALVGPAGAGKYKLAKNFAGIVHKVAGPLTGAIYPEIARLVAGGDRRLFGRIFRDVNIGCGLFGLAAVGGWALLGSHILHFTVGERYADSYATVLILTLAIAIAFFGVACAPTLLALQKWRETFLIAVVSTIAFFASAAVLALHFGAEGAAMAQAISYATELILALWIIRSAVKVHPWHEPQGLVPSPQPAK